MNQMKNVTFVLVGLLVVGLSSFTLLKTGYQIEDKVSNFKLTNVDGKQVSLSDYSKSKGVIVVFTCNHCPYSKKYESRIMDLDKRYKTQGWPVLAISSNDPKVEPEDSFENMQQLAKEKGYSFPYLFDETQEVAKAFGALKTPHVFLLENKNNAFVVKYIGAIDDNTDDEKAVTINYVDRAISKLNDGMEPDPSSTKAIGCSIKWKKTETKN